MPASDARLLLCGWAVVWAIPSWQVALTDAFELERRVTAGTADADGVGSEVEELPGKRVVPRARCVRIRDHPDLRSTSGALPAPTPVRVGGGGSGALRRIDAGDAVNLHRFSPSS
jgi:hypothetical protein